MSTLRLFGCAIGILGLLATFLIYRGARWNRSSFILLTILNLSLITITINPNVLNVLRDALSLQKAYRGRIIALLIVSNIFLLFYIFFTKLNGIGQVCLGLQNLVFCCHAHFIIVAGHILLGFQAFYNGLGYHYRFLGKKANRPAFPTL